MNRPALAIFVGVAVVAIGSLAAGEKPLEPRPNNSGVEARGAVPREATALCVDGSWSSAENRRGACSGHGGLLRWFGKPPKGATARCNDGTYSKSKEPRGACSKHGGVAYTLKESKPRS
jgi:hypothetical protein